MLDFGFSEILLTSVIALVVLGPERLPKVARQIGNWVGRARVLSRQLGEQLEREVSAEELLRQRSRPSSPAASAQPAAGGEPAVHPAPGEVTAAPASSPEPEPTPSAAATAPAPPSPATPVPSATAHPAEPATPAAEAEAERSIRPPND